MGCKQQASTISHRDQFDKEGHSGGGFSAVRTEFARGWMCPGWLPFEKVPPPPDNNFVTSAAPEGRAEIEDRGIGSAKMLWSENPYHRFSTRKKIRALPTRTDITDRGMAEKPALRKNVLVVVVSVQFDNYDTLAGVDEMNGPA